MLKSMNNSAESLKIPNNTTLSVNQNLVAELWSNTQQIIDLLIANPEKILWRDVFLKNFKWLDDWNDFCVNLLWWIEKFNARRKEFWKISVIPNEWYKFIPYTLTSDEPIDITKM
jgi:hypothetical protein